MRGGAGRTDAGRAGPRRGAGRRPVAILLLAVLAAVAATVAAASSGGATAASNGGKIVAVGAESEYADVIGQVGGEYVQASAIMSNPNTDPHSFEASIAVAREVGNARLIVQNGIGYDDFMNSIESASPNSGRTVINVQQLADYLLTALGADNLTPWTFQADIMNGVDPSPQNVAAQRALFTGHKVQVFLYNQQVTDALTQSFITLAEQNHIPVVGVYETMPVPGYDYQTWMQTEVQDLRKAVADKVSTEHL
jgi:ABC-type Zn uptake system ZnuABC Zn-binding protein ZnuA